MSVEPTNLEAVKNFAERVFVNGLNSRKNYNQKMSALERATMLAQDINESLQKDSEDNNLQSVEVEEVFQWVVGHDIPREYNEGGEAIISAILGLLGDLPTVIRPFTKNYNDACKAIQAYEENNGPIQMLPLDTHTMLGVERVRSARPRRSAASNLFSPSPCHETTYFPAVPPRVILNNGIYANRYEQMGPAEWIQIADQTENFFELLCCLRRLVEPMRNKFSSIYLGSESPEGTINTSLKSCEHGIHFAAYRNAKAGGADICDLKDVFSKHNDTEKYVQKLEQLFVKNKFMLAAYASTQNNFVAIGRYFPYLPDHVYRNSLRRCNCSYNLKDSEMIFPIFEPANYRRMTRHALSLSIQEAAQGLGIESATLQASENPENQLEHNDCFYKKIHDYYEQKHAEWIAEAKTIDEERKPFFDRAVLESLPRLSREQIVAQWKKDDPKLFERIENNVAFNTQIANTPGYETRRRGPGQSVNAETVTAEGPTESPDKLGTRP